MINELGMGDYVVSLTTISTPHFDSKTMDLFVKLPEFLYKFVSIFISFYFRLLGIYLEASPDSIWFYKA